MIKQVAYGVTTIVLHAPLQSEENLLYSMCLIAGKINFCVWSPINFVNEAFWVHRPAWLELEYI